MTSITDNEKRAVVEAAVDDALSDYGETIDYDRLVDGLEQRGCTFFS